MDILFAFAGAILVLYLLEVHWHPHAATHEGESGMGGTGHLEPVTHREFLGRLLPLFLGSAALPLVFKSLFAGASLAACALVLCVVFWRPGSQRTG
ncbi:hypothetical protein [Desulfolutivibrio sulfoxidireducens]|uniref:hypothetical protein n=1 Tax=Desulfolutivibrio sulfoxidireducens TaxID=2773299 RepID=UPI00159E9F6C|nr:hypothetical protein [Desulfolutivibrio sulfoxidireducens]QLA16200.1 hypothetical protein GD605_08705 [Desulfolutivibrio sulfoxidireducens]QLA19902.1 hypothetical protein GD604_09245 [Desulfolutivibrio sulfoxidireducens]